MVGSSQNLAALSPFKAFQGRDYLEVHTNRDPNPRNKIATALQGCTRNSAKRHCCMLAENAHNVSASSASAELWHISGGQGRRRSTGWGHTEDELLATARTSRKSCRS